MLFYNVKLSKSFELGAQNIEIFTYGTFKNPNAKEIMDGKKKKKTMHCFEKGQP
jgi:hypothetical protein